MTNDSLGTIGDFRAATTVPEEPEATAEDTSSDAPTNVEERYWYDLDRANVSKTEALEILDAVLEQGAYTEDWALSSRVHGSFTTRTYADAIRLQDVLEARQVTFQGTYNEVVTRYNLAASLNTYVTPKQDKKFEHKNDEDFLNNVDFVASLPLPVVAKLGQKLADFDQKITLVFAEGAPENF